MSSQPECKAAFEARLDGPSGQESWQRHVAGCDTCRAESRTLGLLMAPLREEDPPRLAETAQVALEDDFVARIRREDAPPIPAGDARRRWYLAGAIAAAILLLLSAAWIVASGRDSQRSGVDREGRATDKRPPEPEIGRKGDPGQVLPLMIRATGGRVVHHTAAGVVAAPPSRLSPGTGLETMEAQAFATLESPARDLRLRLGSRSRLRRLPDSQHHLRLERGELMTEVRSKNAGGSLRIHTPQGTVTVRGTQFKVQVGAGKTIVSVVHGVVLYHSRAAGAHLVGQGKRLEDDSQRVTVKAAQGLGVTSPRGPDAGVSKNRATCSVKRIRRLIRSNRARAARTAIAACRKAGVHATTATRLKMLDAQALLSLGQVGAAVRAYHRIARQHRGSRVGQNALFTAGQLELSRLGQRKRALATFGRYLRAYPSGRYASDARQLVRTLEKQK